MNEDRRLRVLRALAMLCTLLMLLVVASSAWLRLSQPRAACSDWPACRSAVAHAGDGAVQAVAAPALQGLARAVHRGAASLVLLAAAALVVLALARRPRLQAPGALALALLTLALALAALGIVTPGSRSAAVLLGNLLGGLLMFALAWRLRCRLTPHAAMAGPAGDAGVPALAFAIALPAWLAQAALGTLSGSGQVALAPPAHLLMAIVLLPLAGWIGWHARAAGRRAEGSALLLVVTLQALLGGTAAAWAATPAAVWLHNLGGALGLALLLGLAPAWAPRRGRRAHAHP